MMWAWSFACRTVDEVGALLRALGKHRYLREVDHRLHRLVDVVLADEPMFRPRAAELEAMRRADPDFDLSSYDPRLWRPASAEEVTEALAVFWSGTHRGRRAGDALLERLNALELPRPEHAPFGGDAEEAAHPQLVQLSWTLLPVVDLNPERHAGALRAMLEAAEEVDVSAPVEQEGPDVGAIELARGAPRGVLAGEFLVWSEGPYAYADYVFRGASKVAGLPDPPEGERDLDDDGDDEGELAAEGAKALPRGVAGARERKTAGDRAMGPLWAGVRKGLDRKGGLSRVRVP